MYVNLLGTVKDINTNKYAYTYYQIHYNVQCIEEKVSKNDIYVLHLYKHLM